MELRVGFSRPHTYNGYRVLECGQCTEIPLTTELPPFPLGTITQAVTTNANGCLVNTVTCTAPVAVQATGLGVSAEASYETKDLIHLRDN